MSHIERFRSINNRLPACLGVCLAAGLWGFTSTGGALPWAKRSAKALQRGAKDGGGPLIDAGRGIVVAGPIRKGGMMLEFAALVGLLAVVGVGTYIYVDRYRGLEEEQTTQ